MTTAREIQQSFYENLGNREYDCFQSTEHKYLKLKIAYTLFGSPENDERFNNLDGDYTVAQLYNDKQNKLINDIHSVIKSRSVYNEDSGQVIVSFLFNCCEVLKKKNETNEQNEGNLYCFPVYRVRKCSGSPTNTNCCVFIDEHCRIYKNWNDYLKNNKIPKSKMTVPKDGKYKGNMDDEVELQELLSPACALKEKIIKVTDYSSTAGSLVAGGITIGAMIPAITVAPIVLTGALLTGAGIGVYSMIRSSLVLHDRRKHGQSISVTNDESRNCYLNIAAGATSVVTTGATKIASVALNKGVVIGEGAATALLSVNALNITVNGCNVANSIYSIANGIKNKVNPTALDIMHLTTTFLFFGNAVINFRSAYVIYNDSQSRSFSDMIQTRSQDLWNRAKARFFNSDMTSTDNNSGVKIINDSNEYCSNIINLTIREKEQEIVQNFVANFMINIISEIDIDSLLNFGLMIIENKDNLYALCKLILSRFERKIQEILLTLTKYLIDNVIQSVYDEINKIFPHSEKIVIFLNFIINFIKFKVSEMEIEYHQKKSNTMRELNITEEVYDDNVGGFSNHNERMIYFLKLTVLKMVCDNGRPHEIFFREMIRYFYDWISEKILQYTLRASNNENNQQITTSRRRVLCNDCGGHYFID